VGARTLVGVLDVVGIVLFGFIASLGATELSGAAPTTILGVTLPRLDNAGLLTLVVIVLGVFVVKAVLAISLSWAIAKLIARIEVRNAGLLTENLLRGSLDHAKRYSKAEFQYAITQASNWAFTGILNNVAGIVAESFLLVLVAIAFFLVDPV